ncbi:hypothetical protein SLS53_007997 [Cytospora paraplurivora]|uniref:EXPERA domain-containing protein n=1 Tax=Cytospora paraplurivora TaxID=2898453 RepID=A0AAN9U005_9PEZI
MSIDIQTPLHPYYPLGIVIADYVAPTLSTLEILAIFTVTCLSILTPTWFYVRRQKHRIDGKDAAATLWFVLCGFIHLGLEGTEYSRPELVYFFGYYVFLNAFWIIIPLGLLTQSTQETAKAFAVVRKNEARRTGRASAR